MATTNSKFFESGTNKQFEWVLNKYQDAIQAKADSKSSKSETLLKLDKWYQNELPKKIKSRGKEAHLTHEEIVQTIKWKLARGVFRPKLKDLIMMNTPRVVMQETKKAFRILQKRNDLEAAVLALSNLKGVGPAMASAVLAAGAPEVAPFMADECLMSMPDAEGIDYTMKEYMKLVEQTKQCVLRLNAQGGDWTVHKVELAVWTQYVCRDLKPELMDDMPGRNERVATPEPENGVDSPIPEVNGEDSNQDSVVSNGTEDTNGSTETEEADIAREDSVHVSNGGFVQEEPVLENGDIRNQQNDYQENGDRRNQQDDYQIPNSDNYQIPNSDDYQIPNFTNTSVEVAGEGVNKRPLADLEEIIENGAEEQPDAKRIREDEQTEENVSHHEATNGVGEQQHHAIMSGGD